MASFKNQRRVIGLSQYMTLLYFLENAQQLSCLHFLYAFWLTEQFKYLVKTVKWMGKPQRIFPNFIKYFIALLTTRMGLIPEIPTKTRFEGVNAVKNQSKSRWFYQKLRWLQRMIFSPETFCTICIFYLLSKTADKKSWMNLKQATYRNISYRFS